MQGLGFRPSCQAACLFALLATQRARLVTRFGANSSLTERYFRTIKVGNPFQGYFFDPNSPKFY